MILSYHVFEENQSLTLRLFLHFICSFMSSHSLKDPACPNTSSLPCFKNHRGILFDLDRIGQILAFQGDSVPVSIGSAMLARTSPRQKISCVKLNCRTVSNKTDPAAASWRIELGRNLFPCFALRPFPSLSQQVGMIIPPGIL